VSQENPPVAEHHLNFDPFGARQDENYCPQDQQSNGVESRQHEDSTIRRDLPTFGPRLFNDGVEVDITGRPLSRPNSPAVFSQFQQGSIHVERKMAAERPTEEKDSSLDFLKASTWMTENQYGIVLRPKGRVAKSNNRCGPSLRERLVETALVGAMS
jgi:hypothetical protein